MAKKTNGRIALSKIVAIVIFLTIGVNSTAQIVLQRCDVNNLWTGSNSITVDQNEKKEGIASLSFKGSGTDWFKKSFSQTNVGVDETGWFSFWLYVSDVNKFTNDGQIELSSSGEADKDEYSWSVLNLELNNGWNHVKLQLSKANKIGSPSLKSINYFRIYQFLSGEITAKIDDLRFTTSENPVSSTDPLDIPKVDFSTLDGKVMFGYQGWFQAPGDGSKVNNWRHWGTLQNENELGVEMFPDMREYEADEKYETGLTYADGRVAKVYSAYNKKTVMRHMKWLRDYKLDGVFLQRFNTSLRDSKLREARDTVTMNIMAGCEKYERAFVNMWDLSGLSAGCAEELIADWKHLVDDLKITQSPSYLNHRGKPLVAIWGFTVRDELPKADLKKMIDFFKNSPEEKYRATIMLGTNHDFFNRSSWADELKRADVISPWAVGRFGNASGNLDFIKNYVKPGQDWCDKNNIDFLPGVWPGFSWYNLKNKGESYKNQIKRDGGNFFWAQTNRTISSNAKSVYIAMFDEVDEATAMYKVSENAEQSPAQGYWLSLDADGKNLPSDWYLRCAQLATQVVKGETNNRISLDTPPDGIDAYQVKASHTKCGTTKGKLTFIYPKIESGQKLEFSVDGGKTYNYTTKDGSTSMESGELKGGVYSVWMRRADGSFPTDLGNYTIFDVQPSASIKVIDATCGYEDGIINYNISDDLYLGSLQFSFDGGNSYPVTSTEGKWNFKSAEHAPGNYDIWCRWNDETCASKIKTITIGDDPIDISLFPEIDGTQIVVDENVIRVCKGHILTITAEPADENWTWEWSGPIDYEASARDVVITENLSTDIFGRYEVAYSNEDGSCKNDLKFFIRAEANCTQVGVVDVLAQSNCIVFPNPTQGTVQFNMGTGIIKTLEIKDVAGRTVKTFNELNTDSYVVDFSSIINGVYIYAIENNAEKWIFGRIVRR